MQSLGFSQVNPGILTLPLTMEVPLGHFVLPVFRSVEDGELWMWQIGLVFAGVHDSVVPVCSCAWETVAKRVAATMVRAVFTYGVFLI